MISRSKSWDWSEVRREVLGFFGVIGVIKGNSWTIWEIWVRIWW
jgi:hypothetical protein